MCIVSVELRKKAIERFTNLIDGKVRPGVSVGQIIDYINSQGTVAPVIHGNIEQQFMNAHFDHMINEEDYLPY